ncbi:MAG: aminodeoxychorismate/anthranilate synthase component II [Deltaproteobacteria bacterium]|nr:aminodeoxychorismate/anthranilate synthase component II [Deltaproteobacteria bacterium]
MLLMIDNYDSFTYNLVQYFGELGEEISVYRNDKISLDDIKQLQPEMIVISPGPGRPDDAGISKKMIETYKGVYPILGVCLGHQCIGEVFGGTIKRAGRIMHGKVSAVQHNGRKLFKGIPQNFDATRYHSLVVEPESCPSCLSVTARTADGEIMGFRHKKFLIEGIQFHPESILTTVGMDILRNFIKLAKGFKNN